MDYIFPFDTCEKKQEIIAQPYSVFINLLSCCIIIYYLIKSKNKKVQVFLFSILLFEVFHTFSHSVHIEGKLQAIITHTLAVISNLALFYLLYNKLSKELILSLCIISIFDFYFLYKNQTILYIGTQILIFMLLYYNINKNLIILPLIVFLLVINEKYNCKKMLNKYPTVPFHCLTEIFGSLVFYNMCNTVYKL